MSSARVTGRRSAVVALALVVVFACCQKSRDAGNTVAHDTSDAAIAAPSAAPQHHEPTWWDLLSDDRALGSDMKGQLDRIDSILASKLFLSPTAATRSLYDESESQLPRLRELAADSRRSADPRVYLQIAFMASRRAREDGTILYKMLVKNAERSAGRPWFIIGAKILDLKEEDQTTIGRVEMDPGTNPLFIGARFLTPFVDGDRVDIVGYFAGDRTYETKAGAKVTIPAFAVAGMFKPGTIVAMNRLVKLWQGDPVPDQLRSMPRKF
jgi:hypothetical protein